MSFITLEMKTISILRSHCHIFGIRAHDGIFIQYVKAMFNVWWKVLHTVDCVVFLSDDLVHQDI